MRLESPMTSPESARPGSEFSRFVNRPLPSRLWRGARWGVLVGVIWASIEAVFGNWDAGLAFNRYSPPGDPLGLTIAVALVTPLLVCLVGAAFAPLFRTRRGTILLGLLSVLPAIAATAVLAKTRSTAPLWQALVFLLAFLVFAAAFALDIRTDVLEADVDADDPDRDRPHN